MIVCKCGKQFPLVLIGRGYFCECGAELPATANYAHEPASVCTHRGDEVAKLGCGCGALHRCNIGIFCSDRRPTDPLFTIDVKTANGTQIVLSEQNYRSCSGCDGFTKEKPPAPCSVCGKPSTGMCSEHSPFGMCGEPLCDTCKCWRIH